MGLEKKLVVNHESDILLALRVGALLRSTNGLNLGRVAAIEEHSLLSATAGLLPLILLLNLGGLSLDLTGASQRAVLLSHAAREN